MTQQKLTETTENRSALTKKPNFGIFRFIPVYSALLGCHSTSFRRHSSSFRYIPVPFLFISFHSGVIPPHSGIFRFIPVYSVPFRSVLFLCLVTPLHLGPFRANFKFCLGFLARLLVMQRTMAEGTYKDAPI